MRIQATLLLCLSLLTSPVSATVLLCAEDDFHPYSSVQKDRPVGMTVDLMRAAFAEVGVEVKFIVKTYAYCLEAVKQGRFVATFDTAKTPERQADYLWSSKPITTVHVMLWGMNSLPYSQVGYPELQGKRVGIVHGYEYPPALLADKSIIKVLSNSEAINLRNVAINRLDFTPIDIRVADSLIHRYKLKERVRSFGELSALDLYAIFSHRHPQAATLFKQFEQGFEQLLRNGRYQEIETEWSTSK